MKRVQDMIKSFLPLSVVTILRDRRDWFLDGKGFFLARRQFEDHSFAVDVTATLKSVIIPSKTILFYPQRPRPGRHSIEYRICALLGYAITADPTRRFDIAFKRKNATYFDSQDLQKIPVNSNKIINARSLDISKQAVAKAVADVFGYDLEIDPTQYHGKIVEKSNRNGAHDGRVIKGPIAPQNVRFGYVYQREIENTSNKTGVMLDYRIPIYGNEIPLVYLKYRPVETRFENRNSFVEIGEPEKLFTPIELNNILLLARNMGIDYGEFDVLRDIDGQIYVVDTNNTPVGPPRGLSERECKIALKILKKTFARFLDQWTI